MPPTLIENELFGREKGAYTGALTRQVGRFELANGSTILLDEISELSSELQTKLLRVLQEGEFERLGSPQTIKADIRVIAATNQNLAELVRSGKFREDLYYRLNVFPIKVPPLRDRPKDIPILVTAFLNEFSLKMGKHIGKISMRTMDSLTRYSWPGNIRELRNVIERAVIISNTNVLSVELPDVSGRLDNGRTTLDASMIQHITHVLEMTNGVVKGPHGAAKILGLKASTLYTKMKRLGIRARDNKSVTPRAERQKTIVTS